MRILKFIMRLLRTRGERRRQQILTLLSGHPDYEYTLTEICIALKDWAGAVGSDLLVLHRRGYIHRRKDATDRILYQIKRAKEDVAA